jgi:hypothetical protein
VTRTTTATATGTITPTPLCGSGVVISDGRLQVGHNLDPAGDEIVKLSGAMQLTVFAPAIDPSVHGLTLTVVDRTTGAILVSKFVPPGLTPGGSAPGWRVSPTSWKFKDNTGTLAGGINKVKISQRAPGLLSFKVKGKNGAFQIPPPETALRLIVTMGGANEAAVGQCGQIDFNAFDDPPPHCAFLSVFDRLKCR